MHSHRCLSLIKTSFFFLLLFVVSSCGGADSQDSPAEVESDRSKLFFGNDFPSYSVGDLPGPLPESGQNGTTVIDYPPEQPFGCRGGRSVQSLVVDTPTRDMIIDGGGRESCIEVQSECTTVVRARSITLTNCRYCLDLLWGAVLELTATQGSISCDSQLDSVRVRGGSTATLIASEDISLISRRLDSALRVGWDSSVTVDAGENCRLLGDPNIRITGNGVADTTRCTNLGEENSAPPAATAEPEPTPGFQPAPDPIPTPAPSETPSQTNDPIRCRSGSLLVNNSASDLFIDGGGRRRCIGIERGCIADIKARSISLRNCRECIKTSRGATLTLTASGGSISCDSVRDAVLADGGSTIQLEAANNITLRAAGRNRRNDGIQTTRGSAVSLSAPGTCRIEAVGAALNTSDSASIDTGGCGQLLLP